MMTTIELVLVLKVDGGVWNLEKDRKCEENGQKLE